MLATAMIFFEEPPPGYAVLWSASVGAVVAPVAVKVHDSSPRLGSSVVPKERWIASGMLAQWEHDVVQVR